MATAAVEQKPPDELLANIYRIGSKNNVGRNVGRTSFLEVLRLFKSKCLNAFLKREGEIIVDSKWQ